MENPDQLLRAGVSAQLNSQACSCAGTSDPRRVVFCWVTEGNSSREGAARLTRTVASMQI